MHIDNVILFGGIIGVRLIIITSPLYVLDFVYQVAELESYYNLILLWINVSL